MPVLLQKRSGIELRYGRQASPHAGDHKGPRLTPHHSRPYGYSVAFSLLPPLFASVDGYWLTLAVILVGDCGCGLCYTSASPSTFASGRGVLHMFE
jgi:hypothetical protein